MNPKLFIRADGNFQIGLGHLVRCTALAQILKDDFEITFICREIPDASVAELQGGGFGCIKIDKEAEFLGKLTSNTIAVLDGYYFDTDFQRQVKATGAYLVCIDDLHDKEFMADLIINHAPGITPQDYKVQPYTKFALGLEYVLLRPLFLEQTKKKRIIEKIETVMICFGGSDPKSLTESTLEVLIKYPQFKRIIVVTGVSFKSTKSFERIIKKEGRINHYNSLGEKEMLNKMLDAELAVAPSSTILLELFAVGVPAISGYFMENQKESSIFFGNQESALVLGNMNYNYQEKLAEQLNKVFRMDCNKMIRKQKNIMKQTNANLVKIFQNVKILP
jgi:UDP-2,4-diacetamido-2,4,6-trideoxy-beta-L-altropyranose hydrolase